MELNIDNLKDDYIVTKSINCVAYLLLFCNKDKVDIVECEDGLNVFIVKKTEDLFRAYKTYKYRTINCLAIRVDDLQLYNNNIKYIKQMLREYKNRRYEMRREEL